MDSEIEYGNYEISSNLLESDNECQARTVGSFPAEFRYNKDFTLHSIYQHVNNVAFTISITIVLQ